VIIDRTGGYAYRELGSPGLPMNEAVTKLAKVLVAVLKLPQYRLPYLANAKSN
jgi:hypothetical protein